MPKIRIIPCLDLQAGRVVKGINFMDIVDCNDPFSLIDHYAKSGCDEVMFYDISASQEKRKFSLLFIEKIARKLTIPFSVGGGIRSLSDIAEVLKRGASKVSINSAALVDPKFIKQASDCFGSQHITLSLDILRTGTLTHPQWKIFSKGGSKDTGFDAISWAIKASKLGVGELVLNSIDGDGTKSGYDLDLIKVIANQIDIPVIASGGAGKLEHFAQAIRAGASGVLAASVFHYGEINIAELRAYLATQEMR